MKKICRTAALLALVSALLVSGGCWDRRELSTLALVTGIAIDKSEDSTYSVTLQAYKPMSGGSPSGSSGGSDSSGGGDVNSMMQAEGKSITDAITKINRDDSHRVFLQHNQVLVIGKDQAVEGIRPCIDFFLRDIETQMGIWILIADGKASDVISCEPEKEILMSKELVRLIISQQHISSSIGVDLLDIAMAMQSKTKAATVTLAKLEEKDGKKKVILSGMGVLKDDKMVGTLSETETRGYLWLMNKVNSGLILIEPEDSGPISLDIKTARSYMSLKKNSDGKIGVNFRIAVNANIAELSNVEFTDADEFTQMLEIMSEQAIKEEIEAGLEKSKELVADIYGFGEAIHRKYSREWKEMEPQWDTLFPELEVNVEIDLKIVQTGKISKFPKE